MSNKSLETTNSNSLALLKEHISSLKSATHFLRRDELRVRN